MIVPLVCLVFSIQSLYWRLFEGQKEAYDPGTWVQNGLVWGSYFLAIWFLSHKLGKRFSSDKQPYLNSVLHILSTALFVLILPWGMKGAETLFLATKVHTGLEIGILWQWAALFPFLMAQVIILNRPGPYGERRSLKYCWRHLALIFLPYFFVSIILETSLWNFIFSQLFNLPNWAEVFESQHLDWPLIFVVITVLITVLPFLTKFVLITRPLEAGDLRAQLNHQSKSVGITYRDLMVWDAGANQINAAVIGNLPISRYVYITRAMIDEFSPKQIQLVFWHELGHIIQKHLWIHYLFFLVVPGMILIGSDCVDLLLNRFNFSNNPLNLSLTSWQASLLMIILWVLGFTWLSRTLEKHADLYAMKRAPKAHDYCNLLKQLCYMTGVPLRFYSLTHGSINQRIDFLENLIENPNQEFKFQNLIKRMQITLVALLMFIWVYWFIRYGIS